MDRMDVLDSGVEICIQDGEIQRFIDLGLGRGIDATDSSPWKNKSSFQVRPITVMNIMGTEEGGSELRYEREIANASETRGQLSASITDPKAAVSIGIEGEYGRSSSSRCRVFMIKVLNRTVSFKAQCDEGNIRSFFETWLCKWILNNQGDSRSMQLPHEAVEHITKKDCTKFLSQFKVTHYVSSIQLGASEYEMHEAAKI